MIVAPKPSPKVALHGRNGGVSITKSRITVNSDPAKVIGE
jgi:hypothetical protein